MSSGGFNRRQKQIRILRCEGVSELDSKERPRPTKEFYFVAGRLFKNDS